MIQATPQKHIEVLSPFQGPITLPGSLALVDLIPLLIKGTQAMEGGDA